MDSKEEERRFEGKTILITGCDKGIGLGLVKALLREGAHVIATAKDPSSSELNNFEKEQKDNLRLYQLDVTVKDHFTDIKKTLQESGVRGLDVVIANAGIASEEHPHDPAVTSSIEEAIEIFKTNSIGCMLTFQTFYDILQGPKILAVMTSRLGSLALIQADEPDEGNPPGNVTTYRMSKAAVNAFALSFASDPTVISSGIKVICLHPGWVNTYMGSTGGQRPKISVEESASGILDILYEACKLNASDKVDKLAEKHKPSSIFGQEFISTTCVFVNYDGKLIPW